MSQKRCTNEAVAQDAQRPTAMQHLSPAEKLERIKENLRNAKHFMGDWDAGHLGVSEALALIESMEVTGGSASLPAEHGMRVFAPHEGATHMPAALLTNKETDDG